MDQGRDFDSDPAGDRNFCRQLCMWEENGESTRRRVAGRNEDHADPYSNTYKDAVAQSGSVTMVNEYLVQKEEGKAAGSSKSGSSEEQTAADSSDSGSDATGNSTDEETETGSGD